MKDKNNVSRHIYYYFKKLYSIFIVAFLLSGCATPWEKQGHFYRSTQTQVHIESNNKNKVFVNNKYVGDTPLTIPIEYQQEVNKKTRKVSYWETQPGLSLIITIVSLGIYLPFSLIPVDIETSLEPIDSFMGNEFEIIVKSDSDKEWRDKIRFSGEDKYFLNPTQERR